MANTEAKLSLKLMVDTTADKVLYAEASKDFVDFLFHVLTLPVGSVVKLLHEEDVMGCLGDLYRSIQALSVDCMQPNATKGTALNPRIPAVCHPNLLQQDSPDQFIDINKKLYTCFPPRYDSNNISTAATFLPGNRMFPSSSFSGAIPYCNSVSDTEGTYCPVCGKAMSNEMRYVLPRSFSSWRETIARIDEGNYGYVKGVVTYLVADSLEVQPSSGGSTMALIKKSGVKTIDSLVEKPVEVGFNEAKAILKASLETKEVFTTVFLGKDGNINNTLQGIRWTK